jgi:dCTP deaminase
MEADVSTSAAERSGQLVSERDLKELMGRRELVIAPLLDAAAQVDHVGIDLRLDCFFREFIRTQSPYVSPAEPAHGTILREVEAFRDSFFLQPGEFALAQSLEYIALPNDILALLNGRSSLGRRGLVVHATANIVDPGWRGHLVFELANLGSVPIELVPLMRIARLVFLRVGAVEAYKGPYEGQIRITPPPADKLAAALVARRPARESFLIPEDPVPGT